MKVQRVSPFCSCVLASAFLFMGNKGLNALGLEDAGSCN